MVHSWIAWMINSSCVALLSGMSKQKKMLNISVNKYKGKVQIYKWAEY